MYSSLAMALLFTKPPETGHASYRLHPHPTMKWPLGPCNPRPQGHPKQMASIPPFPDPALKHFIG